MDRGSSEAVAWLERVLSSPQFSKLQVGLRLAQIGLLFGLSFVYLLFVVSWVLVEMDPFYFLESAFGHMEK